MFQFPVFIKNYFKCFAIQIDNANFINKFCFEFFLLNSIENVISIIYFEICPNVVFDISIQKLIALSNEYEIDIHEFSLLQMYESDTDSSMVPWEMIITIRIHSIFSKFLSLF